MKNNSIKTILLSLLVTALWGSLYPFIKIGYSAFQIDTTNIPSIMLFRGHSFPYLWDNPDRCVLCQGQEA